MSELREEFGSTEQVRFAKAKMYLTDIDMSDDNEALCRCGKPAEAAIIGREAFVAFCNDCGPKQKTED